MNYKELHSVTIDDVTYEKENLKNWKGLSNGVSSFLKEWFNEHDYVLVSTSGSTGNPKKIKLKKQLMVNSALSTINFLNLKANQSFLLAIPTEYIGGKMMVIRAMICHTNIISITPKISPELPYKKIDFAAFTPVQVEELIKDQLPLLEKIETIIVGGAPVSNSLERKLKGLQNQLYETFGMTETVSHIALRKIGTSYFKTLAPTTVRKNENNQLIIDAPHIEIKELITNDIIELKNKNEFKWLGRKDFVINSGGLKIHPEEIERELSNFINPLYFFITKTPHKTLGEQCTIVYVENHLDQTDILKSIENISSSKKPRKLIPVNEIMFTKSGKIDKIQTLKTYNHGKH